MSSIILYDLPSKGHCACWSLNPWKSRLALNYKGLDYKTEWLEYPDIAPTLKSFGLPPNEKGTPYTIPTMCVDEKEYVMDSAKIAHALEKRHPTPSLHLDSDLLPKVQELTSKGFGALMANLLPRVPDAILTEGSYEFFQRTRKERFGMSLAQLQEEKGGPSAWQEAQAPWKELGELIRAKGGPFVLGDTPSYADFVVVGALQFGRRIGEDVFEQMTAIDPAFLKLYEACSEWLKRDDH